MESAIKLKVQSWSGRNAYSFTKYTEISQKNFRDIQTWWDCHISLFNLLNSHSFTHTSSLSSQESRAPESCTLEATFIDMWCPEQWHCPPPHEIIDNDLNRWRRSTVVKCWSLTGELSLSCAWLIGGQVTTLWVNCPLRFSQRGQLSLSTFRGR